MKIDGKMGEKLSDFSLAHFEWVSFVVEEYEPFNPMYAVSVLRLRCLRREVVRTWSRSIGEDILKSFRSEECLAV